MPTRLHPKLSARYYGPFRVWAQVGAVAYKLQLSDEAHIHPVFHVSQLKKAIGNERIEVTIPPEFKGLEEERILKEVLKTRVIDRQGETVKQVLIQREKGGTETATWEDLTTMQEQFPEAHLEDKVDLLEGRIVRQAGHQGQDNKYKGLKTCYRRKLKM